jgi:hypothetical protein
MHSGRAQKIGFTAAYRTLAAGSAEIGISEPPSDSIVGDFCDHPSLNDHGPRQTEQADLKGTKIPRLQTPYNTGYFSFWNQPFAAENEDRLRQVKIVSACPQKAGAEMATWHHFRASLFYGVFSEIFQTQDAFSMANPEV